MSDALLTLIATPENEELLIDWLLERGHRGFTTFDCAGHGLAHGLSAAEQVSGRKARVGVWLALPLDEARDLVERLGTELEGTDLHYWITPVLDGGPLGGRARPSARGAPRGASS
jgi:hypothetical protein